MVLTDTMVARNKLPHSYGGRSFWRVLPFPLFLLLCICAGCSDTPEKILPQQFSYKVVKKFPHDPTSFTQGLAYDAGIVLEGTGLLGRSSLRRVNLETGETEQQIDLAQNLFGEGITVFQDKIFQLTWKNKRIFVRDRESFTLIGSYPYPRHGWGLTHDQRNLIASDGTATLYFLDPATFEEVKRIIVHDEKANVGHLNELEYIQGRIFANIYKSDKILIINPVSGSIEGWVNLAGLRAELQLNHPEAILNGIMYDNESDRLFVTGKFWPVLFEIRLLPKMD